MMPYMPYVYVPPGPAMVPPPGIAIGGAEQWTQEQNWHQGQWAQPQQYWQEGQPAVDQQQWQEGAGEEEDEASREAKAENKLEVWGNHQTMNMPQILLENIKSSGYFKDLFRLKTYHEILDEIYENVNNLEPWVPGASKVVSAAWCLLYKCFVSRLTKKQLIGMLEHQDSPYIRGIGFLYVRLTIPPKQLWEWVSTYLDDEEEFTLRAPPNQGKPVKMGKFIEDLLLEQRFMDILFPRIPVALQRELKKKVEDHKAERGDVEEPEEPKGRDKGKGSRDRKRDDNGRDQDRGRRSRSRSRDRDGRRSRSQERRKRSRSPARSSDRSRNDKRRRDDDRRDRSRESDRDRNRDRDRDRNRDRGRDRDRGRRSRSKERPPTDEKKPKMSAAQQAQFAKLKAIYCSGDSSSKSTASSSTESETIVLGGNKY